MGKEVSNAIGTQRQFAKQPELPYRLRLQNPHFTTPDLTKRLASETQNLANSLGAVVGLGRDILGLNPEVEARKKQQAETLFNAEKEVAGLTKEGIASFNRKAALQNQSGKYDFTHNKYAMALLEEALGRAAAYSAKVDWANDPNNLHPESVEKSVTAYNDFLRQRYSEMNVNVKNQVAFDKGFWRGTMDGTYKVANEAETRINDDARYKMLSMADIEVQEAIANPTLQGEDFIKTLQPSIRKMQYACRTPQDFDKALAGSLDLIKNDLDGSRLKLIENMTGWNGEQLKKTFNFAPYKAQIGKNCSKEIARQAYEKYKLPNGGFNWEAYNRDKANRPQGMFKNSIPLVDIPISAGDNPDLENLTPEMKGISSKIGGVLFNMGYGDVMQLTSGYRSKEHNAAGGGAENSYHTYGDALDIYLGDLSPDQRKQVESTFAPYFKEVLFHNAGSGDHLHLASYQGGLDNVEDGEDMSYSAYAPGRSENIDSNIRAMINRDRQAYNDQQREIKNTVVSNMYQSTNPADAYAIIDNSPLNPQDKMSLKKSVDAHFKKQAAAKSGKLKGDALKIANYESPMSGTNVFKDMEQAEIYEKRKKLHENGEMDDKGRDYFTDTEQAHYNDVARRLCWYWSKIYGNKQQTSASTAPPTPQQEYDPLLDDVETKTPAPTPKTEEEGQFTKELREGVEELKRQNYSDAQIDAYLEKYAKKNHMDVSQLKLLLGRK